MPNKRKLKSGFLTEERSCRYKEKDSDSGESLNTVFFVYSTDTLCDCRLPKFNDSQKDRKQYAAIDKYRKAYAG